MLKQKQSDNHAQEFEQASVSLKESRRILRFWIHLLIMIVLIPCGNGWNERIGCDANYLFKNPRIITWISLGLRSRQTSQFFSIIRGMHMNRINDHFAKKMQINPALTPCQNFFMSKQSCCSQTDLNSILTTFQYYHKVFYQELKYPIIQYIYDLQLALANNHCSYSPFIGPEFDHKENYYKALMQQINAFQQNFIRETICLLCLSPKDMPNFLYSKQPVAIHSNWILNKEYFIEKTNEIKTILNKLQAMHGQVSHHIINKANNIGETSGTCTYLKNQALNQTFLNEFRLCSDEKECSRVSIQYFGQPASPQYLLYIKMKSKKKSISQARSEILLAANESLGFRGNASDYKPTYGSHIYPEIQVYKTPYKQLW